MSPSMLVFYHMPLIQIDYKLLLVRKFKIEIINLW